MGTSLYSKETIREHLDPADALTAVERTYRAFARDRVLNPSKLTMHLGDDGEWPDRNAFAIDMPAYVGWLDVAGVKWAIATWEVDRHPPISAQILLFDIDRAVFTAALEGMYITGVRTALQSVVGLKHLAPGVLDSVGVFGAGFQGTFQVKLVDQFLDIERFELYDTDQTRAVTRAEQLDAQVSGSVVAASTPEQAAAADAVLTVTDATHPVLESAWLGDAGVVIALGSYRELPDDVILDADHLIVDHPEQCLQRGALADLADRGRLGRDDCDATIGEVLTEAYTDPLGVEDRVVFVPIGLGALDVAIAERVRETTGTDDAVQEFAFE